jgi:2-hydroxychromene-2-carboxylate isomerase
MRKIEWYFDVVSPFAYFCRARLAELGPDAEVVYRPVLLAGLLDHWGQKGPAEIAPKRRYTYRWCQWLAMSLGVPFEFPAAHPFNPLPYLRLIIAAGPTEESVRRVFESLWTTGADPADTGRVAALCDELGVAPDRLAAPEVKAALRASTEAAAAHGIFGVPTFLVEGELFWGLDSLEFLKAWLADPAVLRSEAMRHVDALPVGVARKGV